MKDGTEFMAPRARETGLIVRNLDDEILIFDVDRNQAHVLNRLAALVWTLCDGETTVTDMELRLQQEFDPSANAGTIWQALAQLSEQGLLAEEASQAKVPNRMTRRDMMAKVGLAAMAVPMIASLAVPVASASSTCPGGSVCGAAGTGSSCRIASDCTAQCASGVSSQCTGAVPNGACGHCCAVGGANVGSANCSQCCSGTCNSSGKNCA